MSYIISTMQDFDNFVKMHFDKNTAEFEYFNGFTTATMCKTSLRPLIKTERMHWLINNYTNYQWNKEIEEYFRKSITDNYNYQFNPPPSLYMEQTESNEYVNDDVVDHYNFINNHYTTIALMYGNNETEKDVIDELTDNGYETELSYMSSTSYDYESNYDTYEEDNEYPEFEEDYDY
jgi:hypothetical protein